MSTHSVSEEDCEQLRNLTASSIHIFFKHNFKLEKKKNIIEAMYYILNKNVHLI